MTGDNNVEKVCAAILEMVRTDMVSLAELRQTAHAISPGHGDLNALLTSVLARLLESGVAIGHAVNKTGNYVEFIGWQGSPESRIERAVALISSDARDAEFGVWLALLEKVDRYEM